jgi:hypothetical protein
MMFSFFASKTEIFPRLLYNKTHVLVAHKHTREKECAAQARIKDQKSTSVSLESEVGESNISHRWFSVETLPEDI